VIAYSATLLVELLAAERLRRGTGVGARTASCRQQAVLVLRWFREDTGMPTLARDARVSQATGYRYLHEGIDVLAAQAPDLHEVLAAGKAAGWTQVTVDGTLVRTDRVRVPGPTARNDRPDRRVDLWWSGKHTAHGGNIQVVAAPDGWPIWTSAVRPGREHDTTALRSHAEALPLLAEWADEDHAALADLGYEGERTALTTPIKHGAGRRLTDDQRTVNLCTRPPGPRPNAATPCSRPPSRPCAGSASAPGASAPSPPPPSSCFTTSTTGPHDHREGRASTGNGSLMPSGASHLPKAVKERNYGFGWARR
jgi:hypothetical protein